MLCSKAIFEKAETTLKSNRPHIIESANEKVVAEMDENGKTFHLIVQKNEERFFDTSCDCLTETEYPLCLHKTVLLLQLFQLKGADYFETIRNWDREKNKLLALYGYSLDDYIEDKFEFSYQEGKPYLKVLDERIQRINGGAVTATRKLPKSNDWDIEQDNTSEEAKIARTTVRYGLVIQQNTDAYPYLSLNVIKGEVNEEGAAFVGKVEKVDLPKFVIAEQMKEEDKNLIQTKTEELNDISRPFAERVMDQAISGAMKGKNIEDKDL